MNLSIKKISFFLLISFNLFAETPPIMCNHFSGDNPEEVTIECDKFGYAELFFYRAKIKNGIYTNLRKSVPSHDMCVPPGKYHYVLEQACPECGFAGYSSCKNYLTVVIGDHDKKCEESGVQVEMSEAEFFSHESEWYYYEDCCNSELSASTHKVEFGNVAVGKTSDNKSVLIETYSCSNVPNDLTPEYYLENSENNVFEITEGESNYSYIPSGNGYTEFFISFTPETSDKYEVKLIFNNLGEKVEVTLTGEGVASDDELSDFFETTDESQEKNDILNELESDDDMGTAQQSKGCSMICV